MRASLQIHAGTLRVHPTGGLGDDYVWSCGVTFDGDTVTLHGAMTAPTPTIWRAVKEELVRHGIKTARYERRRGGALRRYVEIR